MGKPCVRTLLLPDAAIVNFRGLLRGAADQNLSSRPDESGGERNARGDGRLENEREGLTQRGVRRVPKLRGGHPGDTSDASRSEKVS